VNPDSATIVLLPGLDGAGELFGPFLGALADKAIRADHCLVLPLPADIPQDYQSLAEHVSKSLPDGDLILLAESFSTPLAMLLAESHQARVRGMILVAGFCQSPVPPGIGLLPLRPLLAFSPPVPIVEHFLTGIAAPPGCLDAVMETLHKSHSRVLASRVRTVLALRESDCPAPRGLPVLLIQARQDHLIPWEAQSQLERHFPDARVAWINGPHLLLQTEAHACASAVASFLGEI
jgi:pimeloyl-ACP methyl ester carboxylesterase